MIKETNFIDFLKGFLIVFVILGHELQVNYINFDDLFLYILFICLYL